MSWRIGCSGTVAVAVAALIVACGDDTADRNAQDGGADATVDAGVVDGGPLSDGAPAPASDAAPPPVLPSFEVGGAVTGLLGAGLVLDDNAVDPLPVAADGPFTFPTKLVQGAAFWVTVKTQPAAQTCTVTGATGHVQTENVSVAVACVATSSLFTIGGTVSGLTGTVVLQNNATDNLSLSADGAFTFATPIASGAAYMVTVLAQPATQTCTVTNGTGVVGANVTNVALTCL